MDAIVDYKTQDPVKAILDLTDGTGVDSAIEALGSQFTFEACIKQRSQEARSPTSGITAMASTSASRGWNGVSA